jgi:hypothetical protein
MSMKREQREQARRVSEYVDGLLLHRRDADRALEPALDDDAELGELRRLAECLSEMAVVPPEAFRDSLERRLPAMTGSDPGTARAVRVLPRLCKLLAAARARVSDLFAFGWARFPSLPSAAVVLLAALAFILIRSDTHVASAAEILSRSDAALGKLVRPGQLLFRRWKVTSTLTDADGVTVSRPERTIDEWMDGADFERVAGRWYTGAERLLIAYTSVGQGGQRRPNVYFSPGVYREARGVLNIEPTREEFKEAVHRFPEAARHALNQYLDRQYIYLPITGERAFNRAIIEAPRQRASDLPRVVVSFDQSQMLKGRPVYRVRVVDPASIDFNWRSEGPPRVQLAWAEIICYIERDSYLSVRVEKTERFENGRSRHTLKELIESRPIAAADLSLDPFKLEVPEGTPVQRQSAFEQLSGVSSAFSRLSEFTRTLAHGKTHH